MEDAEQAYLDRHMVEGEANPMGRLAIRRLREGLGAAIQNLPRREHHVMRMYYENDMNLKKIDAELGVTESRVCQLHSQAIARLRTRLREW